MMQTVLEDITHSAKTSIGGGRDGFVDWFKGLIILWVVHIHTVFWSGYAYLPELARQVTLLIDIPVFFFISGYLSRPRPFFSALYKMVKQFARLYATYLIISFLLLGGLILTKTLSGGGADNVAAAVTSMLDVEPKGALWEIIRVYGGSLWFLRVYLSMLVVVPLFLGIRSMFNIRYQLLIFILLFATLLSRGYADQDFLFSSYAFVSFYLFFFLLGVIYRSAEDHVQGDMIVLSFIVSVALCVMIFSFDQQHLPLQKYKFPPTIQYLVYSLPLVHLFVVLKRYLPAIVYNGTGKTARLFRWCGRQVFIIFLMQGVACSIPYFFMHHLIPAVNPVFLYVLLLIFNLILTLMLAYGYLFIKERISTTVRKTFKL